jgi:hypothetical protein
VFVKEIIIFRHIKKKETIGNAFGFVASKEVVVAPWFKKPDVELVDASGELLTIYLDVTLPALHQEAILSREKCTAAREKRRQEHIRGRILPAVFSVRIFACLLF